VLGYGLSGDAFHDTSPDPSGSGIARAIRGALADACVEGRDIDYVNLHATGTESNDVAEAAGLRASLGARADEIPASATKSFLGHAQGAAGVLETVASLLCARRGVVPPTLRCARPRPCAPSDPVAADRPRAHATRRFLKVSAAFGGANAALVMGSSVKPRVALDRRVIEVVGISAIGPHGSSLAQLEQWMAQGRSLAGAVLDLEPTSTPRWDPRGLDPSARYATAAAALALADGGVVVRGPLRDRVGLFTGNSRCPARSAWECRSSIERRGLGGVSPIAFAHMTLNAPAGACAKQLSLRGPLLALSTGRGSGLGALACAAQHLATRDDADLMLAGGLDELPIESPEGRAEGAAFALLRATPVREGGRVCVEGWGIAGAAGLLDAVEAALEGLPSVDGIFSALPLIACREPAPSGGCGRASWMSRRWLAGPRRRPRHLRSCLRHRRSDGAKRRGCWWSRVGTRCPARSSWA
jgi:3-oxoacyl-[acyl-carrier-protein] synthase II